VPLIDKAPGFSVPASSTATTAESYLRERGFFVALLGRVDDQLAAWDDCDAFEQMPQALRQTAPAPERPVRPRRVLATLHAALVAALARLDG
jgi:hypothetical protein